MTTKRVDQAAILAAHDTGQIRLVGGLYLWNDTDLVHACAVGATGMLENVLNGLDDGAGAAFEDALLGGLSAAGYSISYLAGLDVDFEGSYQSTAQPLKRRYLFGTMYARYLTSDDAFSADEMQDGVDDGWSLRMALRQRRAAAHA